MNDQQNRNAGLPFPPHGAGPFYSTHHMSICIEGVLRWDDKTLRDLFTDKDGQKKPAKYLRDWLKLQLAEGKRVLPIGKKCEGWSDITGCPGHPTEAGDRRTATPNNQ